MGSCSGGTVSSCSASTVSSCSGGAVSSCSEDVVSSCSGGAVYLFSLSLSCESIISRYKLPNSLSPVQHYQLDQETLQHLALRLSSKARSIYNELRPSFSSTNGGGSAGEDDRDTTDTDEELATSSDKAETRKKKISILVSTEIVAGVADCLVSVKTIVSWLSRCVVLVWCNEGSVS